MNRANCRHANGVSQRVDFIHLLRLVYHGGDDLADAVTHFTRGSIGKRHRQNELRLYALFADQPRDSSDERACLASSRACDDQRWRLRYSGGALLTREFNSWWFGLRVD